MFEEYPQPKNLDEACLQYQEKMHTSSAKKQIQARKDLQEWIEKNYKPRFPEHGPESGCPIEFCPQCKKIDEQIHD
jgi:hypothetical protein